MPHWSDHPDARRGAELFNSGKYFEAHEAWEEVWKHSEGALRNFSQGLIQIAAGCVKIQRRQPAAAARLLAKGMGRVRESEAELGVSWTAGFLAEVECCLREARRCEMENIAAVEVSFLANLRVY